MGMFNVHDSVYMLTAILAMTIATFMTRAFPFVAMKRWRHNRYVTAIGLNLPPAVMLLLVIYCLRDVRFFENPYGAPELVSIAVVVGMHLWKRNSLLSIGAGTALFMVLLKK